MGIFSSQKTFKASGEFIPAAMKNIREAFSEKGYRFNVKSLVSSGKFEDVPLNADSYESYLELQPFDRLLRKVAAINQAEIYDVPLSNYLQVFLQFGFRTIADLNSFINRNSESAYRLAVFQIADTDLDIISSSVAPRNLCLVYLLRNGAGVKEIKKFYDTVGGESDHNYELAERLLNTASNIPFLNK